MSAFRFFGDVKKTEKIVKSCKIIKKYSKYAEKKLLSPNILYG